MAQRIDPVTGEWYDDGQPEGSALGTEAIEAEQAVDPAQPDFDINPFRYTQQSLNPRAEAASGRAQRDPRARSAFTGMPAGLKQVPSFDTLYQNTLPMRAAKIATGDVSQYKGLEGYNKIGDPQSVYGRSQIAGLEGFEGKTQDTMMFDMMEIGKGMGWSEDKINRMLAYSPNRTPMYTGVSGRDQQFQGPRGLISEADKQALISDGLTRQMGRGEVEQVSFGEGDFKRVYQGPGRNSEAFGKKFGDEEQFFMGLAQLSGKPGGKTGRVEGAPNYRGVEGADYGKQKDLDLDLDDPRHMAEVAEIGQRYTSGRGYKVTDRDKGLFEQQRMIDRQFRKAGRVSGSIWESPGKIIQMGAIAAMAAMTGGAAGPLLAGLLAPTLGLAGAATGSVAAGLGGSILTGASMGITGGAMGGLMQSFSSGFEGGIGGTLKNIGMGAGIGGLSGGVLGGLGHAGSLAFGGQGFQGLAGQTVQTGMQGGQTAANQANAMRQLADAGITNPALRAGAALQGGGTFAGGMIPTETVATNWAVSPEQARLNLQFSGGAPGNFNAQGQLIGGSQGVFSGGQSGGKSGADVNVQSGKTSLFDKTKELVSSPGAKAVGKGLMSAAEMGQAQEAQMQQALNRGTGLVSSGQHAGLNQGLAGTGGPGGQFQTGLPDNPYYNRAYYDDLESGQGDYI